MLVDTLREKFHVIQRQKDLAAFLALQEKEQLALEEAQMSIEEMTADVNRQFSEATALITTAAELGLQRVKYEEIIHKGTAFLLEQEGIEAYDVNGEHTLLAFSPYQNIDN